MIRQLALPFPHTPPFDATPFLRGHSNETALAWLDRGRWPHLRLLLWGAPGCGKTHLLHHWAGRTGAVLLSGPQLRLAPPERPMAIDDADLAPERALLHLINGAAEAGLPVLMTAARPPARWDFAIADLASRLRATVAVQIETADELLLRLLLARLLADRQLPVAEPIQALLLNRLPRTQAAIREAVARLDRLALADGRRVTRALALRVVAELAAAEGRGADEDSDARTVTGSPAQRALV